MTVKQKKYINTRRLRFFTMWSLVLSIFFVACNKNNDALMDDSEKTIWLSMHIATPERALPNTKSTIVDPDVITPAPDKEDGIGLENKIHTVRLFVFDLAGNFVANILNAEPNNETITTGAGSRYLTTLYFKLNTHKGKYKLVLVANEEMLENDARLALLNFKGTRDELLSHNAFMSIPLETKQIAGTTIAFTGESEEFDLADASKYIDINGKEYFQINTEVNPIKIQRICSKVELTITNQTEAGEFIKPESALFKIKTLRRIDIRNTTSLFPAEITHPEKVWSSEVSLVGTGLTGTNEIGKKFTFTDQFYAGEYTEGDGFGDGMIDNADLNRRTSSALFLQLEDINGAVYDYIIPIGDPIRDNADKLTGMSMDRNVIYRINVNIVGKHIKVFFIFRVAPEREEELDPIEIYPKN